MDEARRLEKVENFLGYEFKKKSLLKLALVHSSSRLRDDESNLITNERLEFLGDSILGFVITQLVYKIYPDADEGELSRYKSTLVSRRTLAILIREFKLQNTMLVGRSVAGDYTDSVLANLFEAIIGALYLDGGMRRVQAWLDEVFEPRVRMIEANRHERNHKSILQQFSQKMWSEPPLYEDKGSSGPEHSKTFEVLVTLLDGREALGQGSNKKLAEQKAAAATLRKLKRKAAYKVIIDKITG